MYSRRDPFLASVKECRALTSPPSTKEVFHLSLDISGSNIEYTPGDSIGIFPRNGPSTIQKILNLVDISNHNIDEAKEVLEGLEVNKIGLRQAQSLVGENFNDLFDFKNYYNIFEIIERVGKNRISITLLKNNLRPIAPRLYSIASSFIDNPNKVDLTIAIEKYSVDGKEFEGLCSSFLIREAPVNNLKVPIFIQPNPNFRLPSQEKSIIMIGPGTGIAPFRSFIRERELRDAQGRNWLFFGSRTSKNDFYYEEELKNWQKDGHLKLETAFSRESKDKIHVQNKLLKKSDEVWKWIREGCHIYICGNASKMAKAVDQALLAIIAKEGSLKLDEAKEKIKKMRIEKRISKDVY